MPKFRKCQKSANSLQNMEKWYEWPHTGPETTHCGYSAQEAVFGPPNSKPDFLVANRLVLFLL